MSVNIRKVAMMTPGSQDPKLKSVQKLRATVMDLPLPRGGRQQQNWCKIFVPLLISWAGGQPDPFGTNFMIDGAVSSIWKCVYPEISISKLEKYIVVTVVCPTFLNFTVLFEVLGRQRTR